MQQTHSSDDYVDDTPSEYGWVNADVQIGANNLQKKPEGWGDVDAAFQEHKDYIKDSQGDHSNNEEYVPDAPSGDYAEAVDYDVLQLEQHLKMTQMTLPENWGDLDIGKEEHRDFVHEFVDDNADEEDYKEDAPADIPTDILEYNLQLNSKINRYNNNILLAISDPNESGIDTDTHGSDSYEQHADETDYKADAPAETGTQDIIGAYEVQLNQQTLPENWGDLAAGQDEHREGIHGVVLAHTDEEDYKDDAPADTNTPEILGAYDVQLNQRMRTTPENWGDLTVGLNEHREGLHGVVLEHTDEEDYKDDAPAETNTADAGITYDLQLDAQTATLPENWGDLTFAKDEHREKLNKVINDNAEEEDYKDDAPVETSTADVGIEYDLQLQQ